MHEMEMITYHPAREVLFHAETPQVGFPPGSGLHPLLLNMEQPRVELEPAQVRPPILGRSLA